MDVFVSDFDSYSESSSSDDQEDDEFMYGGQASCILLNLQETIGKIDDFLLFERKYVHGDIVCLLKDPYSQMGRVTNVEMVVDLENLNEKKLNDIDSKELQRIRSISTGDYVVSGPWVGKADQITDFVTVLFDDGTRCEFTITGMEKLVPVSPDMVDDYPYYPGQRVKLANSTISKSTQWFCGSREVKHDEGTVCTIDAGLVYVTWLGCALFGSESQPVPPSLQSSKDLTPISCFTHSHWQIGDWCTLPKIRHSGVHNQSSKSPEFQEIFVIAKIRSKIDVLWQDGSESYGLDSSSLGPINTLDAHDFWPHQLVLEKGTCDDQNDRKWGVVKVVESKEKTVKVKWESETEGEDMEETVSAYELIEHPDYTYSHGDLVFRLHKGQNFEDTEQFYSNCHLARIGTVAPHEIFRVEKSEGISATPLLNNDNIEPKLEKSEHDNHTPDSREKDCLKTIYDSTTFNVSRAAIGFLSNVATRLFGSPLYTSLPVASDHVPGNGPVSGFDSEEDDQMFVETSTEAEFKETEESKGVSVSSATKTMKEIRQFDMVNDCSNHHFIDSPGKGSISSQVKKCWLKKVQQEWNILANDLPETIYVRVFEERMDLIQAAVHFEALVEEHFRERCMHILRACKAYLEGVPIGCAFGSQPVELEAQKGNSTGFKIMLAKLVPKLVEAFTSKGFDCANLVTWHGK
ncbi:hypothetical protein Ccrd_000926 [Cynara cardunculus var. scolymus]|uniref:Ubiquitin-conjugating enzyme E2 24 n=1 Tax=Cynara cardunculus var. scolymus TaxID=59895 RepID=A0A103XU69_CYNCS|nr:hypothetical protein Ccrd_000926 [Cynara cardunculus var. scolymus]